MAQDYAGAVRAGAMAASRLHRDLAIRDASDGAGGAIDVFAAIYQLDLPLMLRPLKGLMGAFLNDPCPGILIGTGWRMNIQRFTAAHELGHTASPNIRRLPMHRWLAIRLALAAALVLSAVVSLPAGASGNGKFEGTFNDYTDPASPVGAWHLTGKWSAHLKGQSGKADFTASIAMIRPGSGASPHTHHVLLENGSVTQTATGWIIEGEPTITSNGLAAFPGSTVTVEVTGEATVLPSNVRFTFAGPATGHFTGAPIDGAPVPAASGAVLEAQIVVSVGP